MSDMRKRFALYGFGFAMGLVLVFFFLGGKRASCNWLPNDRILNIIRQKEVLLSEEVKRDMKSLGTDSLSVYRILENGNVDFSKSRVKNEPCRLYWIQGSESQEAILISVEVCDSVATVNSLQRMNAAGE